MGDEREAPAMMKSGVTGPVPECGGRGLAEAGLEPGRLPCRSDPMPGPTADGWQALLTLGGCAESAVSSANTSREALHEVTVMSCTRSCSLRRLHARSQVFRYRKQLESNLKCSLGKVYSIDT